MQIDAGGEQQHPEQQPSDRIGEVLCERHAKSERDLAARRVEIGDLDVQQKEQHDHAGRGQQRRCPGQRIGQLELARIVKPAFSEDELPWLQKLIAALEKDGLVDANEDGVRLP